MGASRMKTCNRCGLTKPDNSFGRLKRAKDGMTLGCRECNREERDKYRTMLDESGLTKRRVYNISRYGLTGEQWVAMRNAQHNRCAVCKRLPAIGDRTFDIDHDHRCCPEQAKSCGKCVRGLVCSPCNFALAIVRDDPVWLRALATYLEDWYTKIGNEGALVR